MFSTAALDRKYKTNDLERSEDPQRAQLLCSIKEQLLKSLNQLETKSKPLDESKLELLSPLGQGTPLDLEGLNSGDDEDHQTPSQNNENESASSSSEGTQMGRFLVIDSDDSDLASSGTGSSLVTSVTPPEDQVISPETIEVIRPVPVRPYQPERPNQIDFALLNALAQREERL